MNPQESADRRPASRRIADELRRAIEAGELQPGAQLPSERELAQTYGTARNTAREAVRLLSEAGLVVAEHGRGVFVRREQPLVRLGNDRYSPKYRATGLSPFLIECAKQGKSGRFDVLAVERRRPPRDVADRLSLDLESESVLRRENIFYADADPVHYVTTYIPWDIAEGTGLLNDEVGHPYGIHGILEERGHVMIRSRDEVNARMPTADEARAMKLPPGVPVIDLLHTSVDQDGLPYELTRFVMRSDLSGLMYDTPIE